MQPPIDDPLARQCGARRQPKISSQRIRAGTASLSSLCAALIGLTAWSALAAPPPPSEGELHTAQCVAALDVQTHELAAQVKAGREELRPLLLGRLMSGTAFIGTAYLAGDRDEMRSRSLLDAAREAQKTLPEKELAARQAACADEGNRLLANANALERAVVSRLATRRLDKLLAD